MQQNLHPVQFKPIYNNRYGSAKVSTEGYVSNMMVMPEHQRKGHGSEILSEVTADADRLGHGLTLHARPELHDWYAKHGFQKTGEDYFGSKALPRLERKPKEIKGI